MDKDFHDYALGLLARAAGFTEPDALTIRFLLGYPDYDVEKRCAKWRDYLRFFSFASLSGL
jgi:hypothetical protein